MCQSHQAIDVQSINLRRLRHQNHEEAEESEKKSWPFDCLDHHFLWCRRPFIIFFCDAAHDEMQQALVPDIIIFFPTFSQLFRLSTFPFFIFQNKTRVLNTFLVEIHSGVYVKENNFCVVVTYILVILGVEIFLDQSGLKFKSKTVRKLGNLHINCWWIWSVSSLC